MPLFSRLPALRGFWGLYLVFTVTSCHRDGKPHLVFSPSPSPTAQHLGYGNLQVSEALPSFISAHQAWPLVYVLKTRSVPYWQRMEQAAMDWSKQLGVNLTVVGSEHPQTTEFVQDQILLVNEQLEAGTLKGLLLGPADSVQLVPVVEKAVAQGIPVITLDTPVNTNVPLCFVGFDNSAAGEAIGAWVVEQLKGKGRVLILEGSQHHDNALDRSQGFLAGLRTGKQITILDRQPADWDYQQAKTLTEEWLGQYSQVDAIVAANDDMALGAIEALKEANRQNVLVTGFDGSEAGLKAIEAGDMAATIDQAPEAQVHLALQLMITYLERPQPLPPSVLIKNTQVINRSTLSSSSVSPAPLPTP